MKKILALLLSVAMLLTLVACGGTSSESGNNVIDTGNFQAHEMPEGDVKLQVHLQCANPTINEEPTEENPTVFNSTRYISDAYLSMYPNVSIEYFYNFTSQDVAGQIEEQTILVNAGTCPDIFFAWGNALQGTGWLADVTSYIEGQPNQYEPGNELWTDMYYDYMWDADQMTRDAHNNIVSVPFYCHTPGTVGLWYNKALFEEYGIESTPTTWQELCDTALKFKENGITGYAPWVGNASIDTGNWDFWSMLAPALAVGYEAIDEDGDKIVTTQENLKAAVEGWFYCENNECVKNLFRLYKYKYAVVLDNGVENIDYETPWVNGQVAILEDGLWRVPGEASNTERQFDYGIFLHPFVSTDTNIEIDGVKVVLDDASKVRVPEKTESGPEKLALAVAYSLMKPELQGREEKVLDYAMDYLKFLSATENMNIVVEEMAGARVGATKTAKAPKVLESWMAQPFNKTLIGSINVGGFAAGDTGSVRNALLEQYVKSMITEEEFFQQWDQEVYTNIHEYAEEQEFDISGYEEYIPSYVEA